MTVAQEQEAKGAGLQETGNGRRRRSAQRRAVRGSLQATEERTAGGVMEHNKHHHNKQEEECEGLQRSQDKHELIHRQCIKQENSTLAWPRSKSVFSLQLLQSDKHSPADVNTATVRADSERTKVDRQLREYNTSHELQSKSEM
ncbi:hypothetical protein WMY93_017890 [Mugilogobius chulae]|uniref:Uncharacterized protein n=1 Tax=Mugilogobius chulae TaxID=88201 RepID=A0AAW0NP61_9GOBI